MILFLINETGLRVFHFFKKSYSLAADCTDLIGDADEYRCLRGGVRGAGTSGPALAGWSRAGRGRGEAGAELHSRAAARAAELALSALSARRDDRDASRRNASCSNEPVHRT